MEQKSFYLSLLTGMTMLVTGSLMSCTEDLAGQPSTTNPIIFVTDNADFTYGKVTRTRGTKVTSISNFGISASVYSAATTYTSAGCGSYFFNESVTAGTPTAHYWPTADYRLSFFGYYPYGNTALTVQSTASATGAPTYAYTVPSAIASQLDVMTGQTTDVLGGGTSPVNMTMKHRCAAIRFSVTNSRSSAITLTSISINGVKYTGTLTGDTWTLGGGTSNFSLAYGSSIAASATANVTGTTNIFMMLPQTIPAGAKIKVVVDGSEELEADLTGSWTAGKQYNYTIEVTNSTIIVVDEDTDIEDWDNVTDLSMTDNSGASIPKRTTANCYLVHNAGSYMIPLVYGNAIKNGDDNVVAYYPGKDGSVTNGVDRFVNHNGNGINAPWITKSTSGSGVNKGMGIVVDGVELLWQDVNGLITEVNVAGDYLYFKVGTFTEGNALIAAKSGNEIVWSWHIWATNETLNTNNLINISAGNGIVNYKISDINLGFVKTGINNYVGRSLYYQWGRKDPFIPAISNLSSGNATIYDINGNNITPGVINSTSTGIQFEQSNSATIADNIKNPTRFYYNSSNYGPCNTDYYNMWSAKLTSDTYDNGGSQSHFFYGNIPEPINKTVYDPCPPGFTVPVGLVAMTINSNTNWDNTNKVLLCNNSYFTSTAYIKALGRRIYNSGALNDVSACCYYWTSQPYDHNNGFSVIKNGGNSGTESSYRANGEPITPMLEY